MISISEQQRIISSLSLERFIWKGNLGVCRCPICGDSEKKINKKRGYFIISKNKKGFSEYFYYCHNCSNNYSLIKFLEKIFPEEYKRVLLEYFQHRNNFEVEEEITYKIEDEDLRGFLEEMKSQGLFEDVSDLEENHEANEYLRKRELSNLQDFYFTENFYVGVYKPLKIFIDDVVSDFIPKSDRRIFWFIKNRVNEIIGIQARALYPTELRYLTVQLKKDEHLIGGLENINFHKTVFVTEGYLDSIFIPNCVSMSSSNFRAPLDTLIKIGAKEIVFIFDNEPYNKQIRKNIERVINLSVLLKDEIKIGVVLFPKEIRFEGKDVNDYVLKFGKNKLLNIIQENTFYNFMAKLKLVSW